MQTAAIYQRQATVEAVGYNRNSTEEQAEKGTIENQHEAIADYCRKNGINLNSHYSDAGVSGMVPFTQRPESARLLEDAKNGLVKLVLVYRIDRLGRDAKVILDAVDELAKYGVEVRSVTEHIDLTSPTGRFMLTMLAGFRRVRA